MSVPTRTVALAVAAGAALVAVPATVAWAITANDGGGGSEAQVRQEYRRAGMGGMGGMAAGGAMERFRGQVSASGRGMARDGTCLEDGVVDDAPASAADAASLARMAEEERLARDLYVEFADAWDLRTFDMISMAEQHHLDAVGALLEAYGLDDPNDGSVAGVYADAELQSLYDELLAQGSASVTAALGASALVEETDIADLRAQNVSSDAVAMVYERLETASERHLRAFVRALDARGEDYESGVLSAAEVEDITGVPAP